MCAIAVLLHYISTFSHLSELSNLSLKLETGEGLGHVPEANVARTRSREASGILLLGEGHLVNVLSEGLGVEGDPLLLPVPDGKKEVRILTD